MLEGASGIENRLGHLESTKFWNRCVPFTKPYESRQVIQSECYHLKKWTKKSAQMLEITFDCAVPSDCELRFQKWA